MKRILICTAFGAVGVLGLGFATSGTASYAYPLPPTSSAEVEPPVVPTTQPPVLTVPPAVDLPSTGTDSADTLSIAAIAGATGLGLLVVARTRRRQPAENS